MTRLFATRLICSLSFILVSAVAQGQVPRLWYTDLDSGPNTGGDAGGGTYVTLYGANFGATQSSSTVTIGGVAAFRIPIWTNTKITVQLGSTNTSGPIQVTTANGASASLPFTVRTGNIRFINPGGNVQSAVDGAAPGDIIYLMNGVSVSRPGSSDGSLTLHDTAGATDRPITLAAYPGATVQIGSIGTGTCGGTNCLEGIRAWDTDWWTIAGMKLVGVDYGLVMTGGDHFRVVGNEMTCPFGDGAGACLETSVASFVSAYGNNVHDTGHVNASALYHGVYFSTNSNHIDFGWNIIADVRGCRGFQTHSSGGQSQFDIKIHDNIIHDTQCDGIVLATVDPSKGSVEVFNNVIYNAGKGPNNPEGTGNWSCVYVPGSTQSGPAGGGVVEVYNNTMYNCGSHPNPPYPARSGVSNGGDNPNLSIRVRNNIINTPPGIPYLDFLGSEITGSNNLFFGNGNGPAGFANSVNADPLFVNLAARDFRLQTNSPARSAGINTGLTYDFDGVPRGPAYDIGAFQSSGGTGGGGGGGGGTPTSNISLSQAALSFIATLGTAVPGQSISISNTGTASATWTGSANQTWITFTPPSGTLAAGASVTVTITPVLTGLAAGNFSGALTITGGANGPQSSVINLVLNAVPAPVPTISAVTNSASYAAPPLSPGLIISIFGTNMGPTSGVAASGATVPTTLGGVRLLFNDAPAPLLYVGAGQINAIVPVSARDFSAATLKVEYNGQTSAVTTVGMSETNPGVFTVDYSGRGQGVVVNQNGTLNTLSTPAAKGSLVSIFVNGLGITTPAFTDGLIVPDTRYRAQFTVSVDIGGVPATVNFAGLAPGAPAGVFRVDVTVPTSVASGERSLVVTGNFFPSVGVTMAVQ